MREPAFLREIHENQIKAHAERVRKGISLNEYMKMVEQREAGIIKRLGLKRIRRQVAGEAALIKVARQEALQGAGVNWREIKNKF